MTGMVLTRRPTIVGRNREMAQLRAALEEARAGRGALIFIGGEAGIGKTAVARRFAEEADASCARTLLGHSYDQETRPLYGPWLASGLLASRPAEPDTERSALTPQRQRMLDFLVDNGPARPGQAATALGLSPNSANQILRRMLRDGLVSQPAYGLYALDPATMPPRQRRQSARQSWRPEGHEAGDPLEHHLGRSPEIVARDVLETLRASSAGPPLVVIFEDLHWADETSLQLLRAVGRGLDQLAVLIICTYRDIELDENQPLYLALPALLREPNVLNITLRRLDPGDVGDLVNAQYGLDPADEARLTSYLNRYAAGNPLFIGELLRTLEHDRILASAAAGWTLSTLPLFQVPPLLRQILDAQIGLLASEDRRLLQIAAVIGEVIPVELWSQVAGVTEDELSPVAERAIEARLIEETPDRLALRFRHALIRERLYARVVLPGRRAWHRRVGEALEQQRGVDPDTVAHHYQQAGDERTADWLVRAGRRAARAAAYSTAATRFELALAIMLNQGDERLGERAWLRCELAEVYRYTDSRRALDHLQTARQLAGQLDDQALVTILMWCEARVRGFRGDKTLNDLESAVDLYQSLEPGDRERILNTPLRFIVSAGALSQWVALCGRYADGLAWGQEFLGQAAPPRTPVENLEHGAAYFGLGLSHAGLGNPEQARAALKAARVHFADNVHLLGLVMDWGLELILIGYYPDAPEERQRHVDELAALWQQTLYGHRLPTSADILDGRWSKARASVAAVLDVESLRVTNARVLAELDRLQGNRTQAWLQIANALPEGPDTTPGTRLYINILQLLRIAAELALDECDLEAATAWIAALQRWRAWSGQVLGRAIPALLLARLHEQQGRFDTARDHAECALALASNPRQPLAILSAQRALGRLATQAGQYPEAERHLSEALAIARACAAPYEIALVQVEQAALFAATGRDRKVETALAAAADTALQLEAAPLLERIEALGQKLTTPPASTRPPAGLTPREVEVLQVAAQGLSDAQIGERLYISRRTVSGHFQTIFGRLGINSRTAAVAFAYEHGII